jgi:hypothetical protein
VFYLGWPSSSAREECKKQITNQYMNNLIKREETKVYPQRRWNDRAYIHFSPFVTWIALKSNVLLLISDFSLIICVKYLWRCFRWRSGLKMPCPLPPWIQQVIMQLSIEFLNILPFIFLLALLSNSFTFYCCILLCILPCWKNIMITSTILIL